MDPILEGHWKNVLDAWDDDALHGKFVSYAQQSGSLGEAAALYKKAAIVEGTPYRLSATQVADAKKRLNGISMLAVMHLEASKSDAGPPSSLRWVKAAAALLLVVAAFLTAFLLGK